MGNWLVVANIFYFPFHIWDVILPIDFHSIIFQDGHIAPPAREKQQEQKQPGFVLFGLYTFSGTGSTVPVRLVAEAAGFPYLGIPRWANISDLDLCTVPSIIRYPSQSLFYIYLLYIYIFEWSCSFLLFVYCTYCSLYILIMLTYRVAMAQETRALLLLL